MDLETGRDRHYLKLGGAKWQQNASDLGNGIWIQDVCAVCRGGGVSGCEVPLKASLLISVKRCQEYVYKLITHILSSWILVNLSRVLELVVQLFPDIGEPVGVDGGGVRGGGGGDVLRVRLDGG